MYIDILTLFPDMFDSFTQTSLIARGIKKKLLHITIFDIRDVTQDQHKTVDGRPFGGGPGMLLRVDIIDRALKAVLGDNKVARNKTRIILLTPQGRRFDQSIAKEFSGYKRLLLICGHYEGFDERIRSLVDEELSIGDFVLTGGELPAMVIVDTVARLVPGFLGKEDSSQEESFQTIDGKILLEYPHYTRPQEYNGASVPEVLLSGNHAEIAKWRYKEAYNKTKKIVRI